MVQKEPKRIVGETFERVYEKTPNGADYSEMRYYNNMMPCKREEASSFVIVEKNHDGTIVKRTIGFTKRYTNNKDIKYEKQE